MSELCPLCSGLGEPFHKNPRQLFYQCKNCSAIFADKNLLPDAKKEYAHYAKHENNVEDKGYQQFVSPITQAILKEFTRKHQGLDFGAGTGPVISKILNDNKFSIKQYDPYFHNYPELLNENYDYIACCEVMEHFFHPKKEFALLKKLLKPAGKLYCMTHIYDESIDFEKWYYKNDPTHVFIYKKNTLNWIRENIGFSKLEIHNRLIIFSN
ncbi:class I SAM-dependent methyltransferase [Marinifilum sp. RC60d5]|uniref:class I SAM-dependent methyltransferase n=1 Tax=Marinifilum sp. RC60d5 TaxID=3458414 RepID=UPI0040371982